VKIFQKVLEGYFFDLKHPVYLFA